MTHLFGIFRQLEETADICINKNLLISRGDKNKENVFYAKFVDRRSCKQ